MPRPVRDLIVCFSSLIAEHARSDDVRLPVGRTLEELRHLIQAVYRHGWPHFAMVDPIMDGVQQAAEGLLLPLTTVRRRDASDAATAAVLSLTKLALLVDDPAEPQAAADAAQAVLRELGARLVQPSSDETTATDPHDAGKHRIPRAEAEIRVRDWLLQHAKDDPAGVTRDAVARATGVSRGGVSQTAAWRAFQARRQADRLPTGREVSLDDRMAAVRHRPS